MISQFEIYYLSFSQGSSTFHLTNSIENSIDAYIIIVFCVLMTS